MGSLIEYIQNNFHLLTAVILIFAIFFIASIYIKINKGNQYIYYSCFFFSLFIAFIYFRKSIFALPHFNPYHLLYVSLSIIGIYFAYRLYKYFHFSHTALDIINGIIIFFFVLFLLAIIYKQFYKQLQIENSLVRNIVELFFYIPRFVMKQFDRTPYIVYKIFIMELLLILLYIYLPRIIQRISIDTNSINLLTTTVFLNDSQQMAKNGIFESTTQPYSIYNSTYKPYRYNYAFSFWLYINPNQTTYIPTNIFYYGEDKTNNIFSITYSNEYKNDVSDTENKNYVDGKYKIQYGPDDNTDMIYMNLPNQKWNYIVINMNQNTMDVFINGVLYKTVKMNVIPSFTVFDTVVVGDKPGVDGAICNIKYHTKPMTNYEITNSYNVLMYKNPPVQ
jgi:hypothetical protein